MRSYTMKLPSPLRLLAAVSLAGASLFAQAADVTIAYQTTTRSSHPRVTPIALRKL